MIPTWMFVAAGLLWVGIVAYVIYGEIRFQREMRKHLPPIIKWIEDQLRRQG